MKITLETNIPLIGQLSYCDYQQGKLWRDPETNTEKQLPDSIRLKGDFEGFEGDSIVYVHLDLANDLVQLGIVQLVNGNGGRPSYNVVSRDRVVITKKEDGKKRFTTVERQNGNAAPTSASPHDTPPAPTDGPLEMHDRRRWVAMHERMKKCVAIAQDVWPPKTPNDVVAASAHTLFIQASRDGLS